MVIVLLRPPAISTAAFTLTNDPETGKMFVEEDSTLRANGFDLGQVYDDAADVGFTLTSSRTGDSVICVETHLEVRDGDVLYWDYTPVLASGRVDPSPKFIVRVFND